jgi:hypothetical protein
MMSDIAAREWQVSGTQCAFPQETLLQNFLPRPQQRHRRIPFFRHFGARRANNTIVIPAKAGIPFSFFLAVLPALLVIPGLAPPPSFRKIRFFACVQKCEFMRNPIWFLFFSPLYGG